MKRNLLIIICLALVVTIVGATGCSRASLPGGSPIVSLSDVGVIFSQQNTGIWVTGEGKVSVVPDVAILNLGVEAQATTVAEAQQQAAEAMADVMEELDKQGVAEKDIKTQHFSIYPVRRWDKDKNEEILVGYRVSNTVMAKIRKVDETGIIIDAVAEVGGDYIRINGISFTVDEPTAYLEEAREKAMADAKTKAEQLADLADVKLGKPTYISESGAYVLVPREYYISEAAVPASAPTTPISPGETEISLTVQVSFSIS